MLSLDASLLAVDKYSGLRLFNFKALIGNQDWGVNVPMDLTIYTDYVA